MYKKKYHMFILFFNFLWLLQTSGMREDVRSKLEKKNQKIVVYSQTNFKKICFGFIDDKVYTFGDSLIETIECAGHIKKIISFLKKRDSFLLKKLYFVCLCKKIEKNCDFCPKIYEELKNSKNKAIKALKEISYKNELILNQNGTLSENSKELIIKVIEMF